MAPLQSKFGVQQFVVDFEFEGSFTAGDEGEAFDDVLVIPENIVRHTGGACPVVSGYAVFQGDDVFFLHDYSPGAEVLMCI